MPAELADGLTATEGERLEQAEALVRGFCGWHIAPSREDETATFAWPTGRRLFLPSLYVTEVTALEVDGVTQVLDTDFQVHRSGWIDRLPYASGWSGDLVTVEFTHGYTTAPADVTAVVQGVAQRLIDTPASLTRVTAGPFTEEYASVFSIGDLDTLRRYRIPTVA